MLYNRINVHLICCDQYAYIRLIIICKTVWASFGKEKAPCKNCILLLRLIGYFERSRHTVSPKGLKQCTLLSHFEEVLSRLFYIRVSSQLYVRLRVKMGVFVWNQIDVTALPPTGDLSALAVSQLWSSTTCTCRYCTLHVWVWWRKRKHLCQKYRLSCSEW